MAQLTFNCQCSIVHYLSTVRSAIDIKCTTSLIAIDCQYANQLPSIFIPAGCVTILCQYQRSIPPPSRWEMCIRTVNTCEHYCCVVSCFQVRNISTSTCM